MGLILTSTHSSTLMTPLIETSSLTGTEPTLRQETTMLIQETLSTVFLPALTVPVSTHSSTLLMLLTNKLSQSNKLSPSPPPLHQGTSSPLVSSSLTGLNPDSTLTSPPNKRRGFLKILESLSLMFNIVPAVVALGVSAIIILF